MNIIDILKVLSDETRLRILSVLNQKKLCVCEMEYILNISQSNASKHLNRLVDVRILEKVKDGNFVFYQFNEKTKSDLTFIEDILSHLQDEPIFKKDQEILDFYVNSNLSREELKGKN